MRRAGLLCAVLSSVVGCGGGWGMAQPGDVLAVSEELPIKDRSAWSGALANESFGLGGYRVSDVDRKWDSKSTKSFFSYSSSTSTGGYAYKLVGQGGELRGECATEAKERARDLGDGAAFSSMVAKLGCRCNDQESAATLTLEASTTDQYEGKIASPDFEYRVTALTQRERGSQTRDPLGYRVDDASAPIGAVELKSPGRVWISRAVEGKRREAIACLFSGLLLYQPPKDR